MNYKMNIISVLIFTLGTMLTFNGCWDGDIVETPGIEFQYTDACLISEDGNVNNCDALTSSKEMETSSIKKSYKGSGGHPTFADFDTNRLYYLARILPVQVDGEYVQSNMVLLSKDGKQAYIAYNTAGNEFRGAIQIVNVNFSGLWINIVKEIKFSDMDINSIYLDGETLFFGASQNPDNDTVYGAMTFVGHLNIKNTESLETIRANMVRLNLNADLAAVSPRGSYAVTGITATDDYYFISVGAYPGGILKVDKTLVSDKLDIANASFTSYSDVRSIAGYNTNIYALQGTDLGDGNTPAVNGNVLFNSQDGTAWDNISIADFGPAGYKATIDIYKNPLNNENGLFFLGLSSGGLQIMSMDNDNGRPGDDININIPVPTLNSDSIAAGFLANTNSASYDSDLIFSANGNYGFRVFQNTKKGHLDKITNPSFEVVGYHNMQGLTYGGVEYSANDIAYRNKVLLVAAGQGGVCVYFLMSN